MKICFYTMTFDGGFAPNPFHGYCSLSACTPNHMGAKLKRDDYLAGFFTNAHAAYLVYWMKVNEVLHYDEYYHDQRFQKKMPDLHGSWQERCGDNIYFRIANGEWGRLPSPYHTEQSEIANDTRHAIVYVGNEFCYFGKLAYEHQLPSQFLSSLKKGKGIKYTRDSDFSFQNLIAWLISHPLGYHGDPRDIEGASLCSKIQNCNVC